MARYSVGIYWDNVYLHACLAKVGISELTIEKFVSIPREYNDHYVPRKKISEEIPLLLKDALAESSDTFVVGVPERESMHRTLLRPFGDRKKISLTITPEMETLLPVINATGVYPIGTLCILDSFEMAVVAAVSKDLERLHQPVVRVISDAMGMPLATPRALDLSSVDPSTGKPLRTIIKTTDPQRYGIKVSDYLL